MNAMLSLADPTRSLRHVQQAQEERWRRWHTAERPSERDAWRKRLEACEPRERELPCVVRGY